MEKYVLEIKNLKKYYGKKRGVEDVSLKINKGEIYGFIGPNGAGKSTSIRSIIGLINKTGGKIFIDGKEFDSNDINIKQKIGYLPSEINLYNDMTVKEILDYHETFYKKDIHKKRLELVKYFDIDESKKACDLSLGNLKKVGVVLSLMHEPILLILDEPTGSLDPIMQKKLHDILKKEKEKGTSILYSSHVLSEVSNLCDKIGFIKDGIIIREDSIKNINDKDYTYLTIYSKDINMIKDDLNIKVIEQKDNMIKLINDVDINILINKLSKYKIDKLLIEEVPLEELFINYYR